MKKVLNLLANPLFVGAISFSASLPLLSPDLEQEEIVSSIPFVFIAFALPFVLISLFTRRQLARSKGPIRLAGLWIGSIGAAIVWTISIVTHDDPQAGLGYIFLGVIAVTAGIVGYIIGWLFERFTLKNIK